MPRPDPDANASPGADQQASPASVLAVMAHSRRRRAVGHLVQAGLAEPSQEFTRPPDRQGVGGQRQRGRQRAGHHDRRWRGHPYERQAPHVHTRRPAQRGHRHDGEAARRAERPLRSAPNSQALASGSRGSRCATSRSASPAGPGLTAEADVAGRRHERAEAAGGRAGTLGRRRAAVKRSPATVEQHQILGCLVAAAYSLLGALSRVDRLRSTICSSVRSSSRAGQPAQVRICGEGGAG
jgi:hypothetical protein